MVVAGFLVPSFFMFSFFMLGFFWFVFFMCSFFVRGLRGYFGRYGLRWLVCSMEVFGSKKTTGADQEGD
jgi:hypothetical protein